MNNVTEPWWPTAILAAVLLGDALISIRPPVFVRDCLNGVKLPSDWWWSLILVKLLAVAGLLVGIVVDGVGLAANVGVVGYFVAASIAHVKARFTGSSFWLNCLGMLTLSLAVLVYTYAW